MVGIAEMTCNELAAIIAQGNVGSSAYYCAMDEISFRDRHPEYRVA